MWRAAGVKGVSIASGSDSHVGFAAGLLPRAAVRPNTILPEHPSFPGTARPPENTVVVVF